MKIRLSKHIEMTSIIKHILLGALRDRLFHGIFIILCAAFSLSIFLGNTMLVEESQTAAAYIAGSSRIIITFGMILFACLNIGRSFANKEIEFILSKNISREQFILSYLAGFLLASALIVIPLTIAIFLLITTNKIGLLTWFFSLLAELTIIISFALLASLILKNSFLAILSSMAFYAVSRLMGIFILAINLPQNFTAMSNDFFKMILQVICVTLPRLDLFGQSSWLVYGIENASNVKIIALQAIIYIPLLVFMSFRDFRCKQF